MREEGYFGREQTQVKHFILREYLKQFAHIIYQSKFESISYVDCFAGPWKGRSDNHEDSSFAIALGELREARQIHVTHGKKPQIRCLFLEERPRAFKDLEAFAAKVTDAEIVCINSTFEASIGNILNFVKMGGSNTFPFFFVDPTGWTGFSLDTISPLLRQKPGEVLINFMTSAIRRFVDHPEAQTSFAQLFGSEDYRARFEGLHGTERDDALTELYTDRVKSAGRFDYACSAIVINPEKARTHFHLIYLTRHPKGVEVFKKIEKKAMTEMESLRADARDRKREARTGIEDLFADQGVSQTSESQYYKELREHYSERAHASVKRALGEERNIAYGDAWKIALAYPLVWETDLKVWIKEWRTSGHIEVKGLGNERTPKYNRPEHRLIWLQS